MAMLPVRIKQRSYAVLTQPTNRDQRPSSGACLRMLTMLLILFRGNFYLAHNRFS